jgi:glucosyl-3-phosphoglycerate phosphatase
VIRQRVVLLRHGRTAYNAGGRFQGQLDTPLDDLGRLQATVAAEELVHLKPAVLIASDSTRAADTAAAVATRTGLEAQLDSRLREIHLGAWSGLTRDEARQQFPDEYEAWMAGHDVARGGGETYGEVGQRAVAAIEDHLPTVGSEGTLVAVTHGGTARATIGTMLGFDAALWWRIAGLANARRTVLVRGPRGWRLVEHNAGTVPDSRTERDAPPLPPAGND